LINARAETVQEKPSFRAAFKKRRCLIAADGFYEWQKPKPGMKGKQPFWITRADHAPFAFAGLWEEWQSPDGEIIESCTIITCAANSFVAPIHLRMPVILDPNDYDLWLGSNGPHSAGNDADNDAGHDARAELLRPYPGEAMAARPVSTYVNSPANDDAKCILEMSS
jgi:putative SOS response-associated peptidase YedK